MSLKRIDLGRDTSGRPLIMDERSLRKLRRAEAALGFTFTIVQGSWSDAAASGDTHTGAGAGDLRTWNLPAHITPQRAVLELRKAGLIAWYRHSGQGFDPHIHFIDYGNPELAPAAQRQVAAWEAGRNGLANNGPDDGPRVTIPKELPEDEMNAAQEAKLDKVAADLERVHKRLDNERERDVAERERATKRHQSLVTRLQKLADQGVTTASLRQILEEERDA